MNKVLKWALIVVASLVIIGWGAIRWMMHETKKHSPEDTVEYNNGDLSLSVFYNRPSKKGRDIFAESDGLIPYGQVWRTGANEATTFETNKDITIGGQSLSAGKYTLWTIPNADSWEIIFNSKMYDWGVNYDGTSIKEDAADVLKVSVPVQQLSSPVEQFTISLEDGANGATLNLAWDDVKISATIQQ